MSDQEHHLRTLIQTLERENAALREKVDDWENAVAHALDHRPDEQHCTCVAPLVGKVQQLERENAALRAALDAAQKEQP
jgi:exonuclease VII small subunit